MSYNLDRAQVIVIGAGHAGIEAALACARLGIDTIIFSMSLDFIANLPCNPSIGGTAKGHLVREIDALGGEMGKAADYATIQSKMLNRGKGPAVHSLRAQIDRSVYHRHLKQVLENQKNLRIKQAEVTEVITDASGHISGVKTRLGAFYSCDAAIMCTGTFLGGKIFVGDHSFESGPDGLHAAMGLTDSLKAHGISVRRFKTGTPARVNSKSIDYSQLTKEPGEDPITPFSFENRIKPHNILPCWIAYTNADTHRLIAENLDKSPLYGGKVNWVGARYCPSIEDKVVRFEGKERHQLFVEPIGLETNEMYIQGLSTSLPEDLQVKIYRSIKGFENAEIMRFAYAIEYDCVDPLELFPTLESKKIGGFYSAGQINGTSGYEEAAAQGLLAGINAANQILDRRQLILTRSSSYIGTLIDDLVTKGTSEPYRMMTSRSEYRLLLRSDNADIRLTPIGRNVGLISDERWEMFHVKQSSIEAEVKRLSKVNLSPSNALDQFLEEKGTASAQNGISLESLLKRPQIDYLSLAAFDQDRPHLADEVWEEAEIIIKYSGYIAAQLEQVEREKKMEELRLNPNIAYGEISGLRLEAREKLAKIKPLNIAQASRISGVSPSDISVLLVYLKQNKIQPNKKTEEESKSE